MSDNSDDYNWLRDPLWPDVKDQKVLDFLQQHNKEAEGYFASLEPLICQIEKEIKSTIALDDKTVPIQKGDFLYWSFIKEGQDYWTHVRKSKLQAENSYTILLDENALALGKPYCNVGKITVSHDHTKLAYAVDYKGDERYSIIVIDLATNTIIDEQIHGAFAEIIWNKQSTGFFYLPANQYWRADKLHFHQLSSEKDVEILSITDSRFQIALEESLSRQCIFAHVQSSNENMVYAIDETSPTPAEVLIPLKEKQLVKITERNGDFFFLINDKGRNFRLCKCNSPIQNAGNWQELIAHNPKTYLEEIIAYDKALVLLIRNCKTGLRSFTIIDADGDILHRFRPLDESYDLALMPTDYYDKAVRFSYSAMNRPLSIYQIDFARYAKTLLKSWKFTRAFSPSDYHVSRLYIESTDGAYVPVSLVYKKEHFKKDGTNPLYLYGYGSYGIAVPARFRGSILSLLDRGFIYAIAHIRGGDDCGYDWYESAKLLHKKRTFEDFVNCAKALIQLQYTFKGGITIMGGSAGGMLVAAALNMEPSLFAAVVAHVPFVDVLSTMLDDTLPLTPLEYKEWGNPKDKDCYEYIKSYSPIDNLQHISYPAIFATAGLSDPRVAYWEPAKWIAKIKEMNSCQSKPVLLKTNMDYGHSGASGRLTEIREYAEEFAFVIANSNAKKQ